MRTRKAGSIRFIDLHIVMPGIRSFKKAHKIAENLTLELQREFEDAQINIHIDPQDDQHEPTNQGGGIFCSLG
jgi:divalent metal cation (Fe/Co/Zn/Cd) transporter